jgi:hypothetical protein
VIIPDDEDRDGPRNVGLFYSSDAADRREDFLENNQVPRAQLKMHMLENEVDCRQTRVP